MVCIVAGGAGFIGAGLTRRLLDRGHTVVAADNLSRGRAEHLSAVAGHPAFRLIEADLASAAGCKVVFEAAAELGAIDTVWHLAANSDIPAGVADARIDLKDTFLTTFEILAAMRAHGAPRLMFASSSAVYGDLGDVALAEDSGPLLPISNYGAMKLASEAQIAAAAESFLAQALLFRFPNVVGTPATHGALVDFTRRLKADPTVLRVLGDGTQRKPYLHVDELIEAMFAAHDGAPQGVRPYNIGPPDHGVTVRWMAQKVVERVSPGARLEFGSGPRGWVGDVPRFHYALDAIAALGWRPALDSAGAVSRAIDEIARQEGL